MNIFVEPEAPQRYKGTLLNRGGREFQYTLSVDKDRKIQAIFSKDQFGELEHVNDDYFRILKEEFEPLLSTAASCS